MGKGFARRMRPDTRATDRAWQWPKSGGARRNPAIDKGRTPSYLSPIPAATPKKAPYCEGIDARSGGGLQGSLQKGFAPLRSLVVHSHRFSLDRTDRRIDILMMGRTAAPRRVTGFPA
jgi:hypothetical protein